MKINIGKIPRLASFVRTMSVVLVATCGLQSGAMAAGLINRDDTVSTSQAGVVATHTIAFTTATRASIGSIGFLFCTSAVGACVTPAGLITTAATLVAENGVSGYALNAAVNGDPFLENNGAPNLFAGTSVGFTLNGITNPSAINTSFYIRISTYTGTDGATGLVDTGNVAVSTTQPVQLTGTTPEILVFCVGITMGNDCTTVAGSTIDFGDFSPTLTRTGSSVMQAQTNAGGGYVITVNGTTLASGVNTIPGLATQTASTLGDSQFGLHLTETGAGTGVVDSDYSLNGFYRFDDGDIVASSNSPTNANTFTSDYIVNIDGLQAAGLYTATMTYICTASF